MLVFSATAPQTSALKAVVTAYNIMKALSQAPPAADELERARSSLSSQLSQQFSQPAGLAEAWLDVDTFKSSRPSTVSVLLRSLTAADIQRVAGRLFKDASAATVVVGSAEQLNSQFSGWGPTPNAPAPHVKP
jgi:predicted Zn-dependent peptidase